MYIFDKPYKYYDKPWPHIVIEPFLPSDVADHMRDYFPPAGLSHKEQKHNKWAGDYLDDPVFAEFSRVNEEREQDIYDFLDNVFDDPGDLYGWTPFQYRNERPREERIKLKGWHTDLPGKKYHIMMYLGGGENGELEMKHFGTEEFKSFPYVHNRLVAWRNDPFTHHRFWTSKSRRFTISLGIELYEAARKTIYWIEDSKGKVFKRAFTELEFAEDYARETNAKILRGPDATYHL